jgi:hypothetical protein
MLTAKPAVYVADAILRSRKTVSVYSDYFYLVVSSDGETGIMKRFVHFMVGCDPVTEPMTFLSTCRSVKKMSVLGSTA